MIGKLNPELDRRFLPLAFDLGRRANPRVAVGVVPNKTFQLSQLLLRQGPKLDASAPHCCGIRGGAVSHLAIQNGLNRDPIQAKTITGQYDIQFKRFVGPLLRGNITKHKPGLANIYDLAHDIDILTQNGRTGPEHNKRTVTDLESLMLSSVNELVPIVHVIHV
jgi:hypothetical protein